MRYKRSPLSRVVLVACSYCSTSVYQLDLRIYPAPGVGGGSPPQGFQEVTLPRKTACSCKAGTFRRITAQR
jgi:hypothetical protein